MKNNSIKRTFTSENELIDIFQQQYNDIFCQMLIIDQFNFFTVLKKQVITYLEIQNKQASQAVLKKVEEIFVKKYLEEKEIVSKDLEVIKELPNEQLDYLDRLNCIIHCPKCKDALHTCGLKFVLYGDYVYCLSCMKVYNEKQVNMYCDECDVEYYTQLREIVDYDLESYFFVSISNYHCKLDYEEKIVCPQCEKVLYVDINSFNNLDKIEEVICINCNLIFDVTLFNYKCKKCGKNFKSDAKIFNSFCGKKNDLICKVHTLSNKKFASPEYIINKGCDCNLNYIMKYKHSDGGILFLGERNGLKVILCDKCYEIFDYYNFIFSCPLCNKNFNPSQTDTCQRINGGYESSNFPNKEYNKFKYERGNSQKNTIYLQKNRTLRKIPVMAKQHYNTNKSNSIQAEGCHKCQCSSTNKPQMKSKNAINENPFSTRTKLLKSSNNKINLKNMSKTPREKEMLKNKIYTQPYQNNTSQRINIRIQNFYNNYVPIIHIVEKNAKNNDRVRNSKYILKRNYEIINTSPRVNRTNRTIVNNPNNISNALKRSITETEKYCLCFDSQNKRKNIINDKDKEYNNNIYNNLWDSKKKYSASFTDVSINQRRSNYLDYGFNNVYCTASLSKERKKRNSIENDKIAHKFGNTNYNTKIKKKDNEKFNVSDIYNKNKKLNKVNPIKETKEEYTNELKEIKSIKPKKVIKLENNNINTGTNKSGKNRKDNKVMSLSLSMEKDKKIMEKDEKKISETNINTENNKKAKKIKSKVNNNISTNINNLNSSIKKASNSTTTSSGGSKAVIPTNVKKTKKIQKNNKNEKNEKKVTPKSDALKGFNSEDYNILNIIGEGTFSQIFLVEDNKTHEKFALKKMAGTKLEDLEEKKFEFEFIMKLTKEDEKLNLVKIYGIQIKQLDKFNMVLYILMESAKSDWETELKNRHYDKKFYTEEELKNILISLVQTFSSLQRRGICHRDVKPQNILSFGNGVYKITDFGEAKANKKDYKSNFSQDTSVQTVRGTELYMSPILFNALRQNPGDDLQYNAFKSDVFSLGLCFLLACTLSYKPLYQMRDANNMNTIKDIFDKYIKNRYSKNITELLFTMLQLEEKDRPDFIELESMIKKIYN